jgi:hypothetical protein
MVLDILAGMLHGVGKRVTPVGPGRLPTASTDTTSAPAIAVAPDNQRESTLRLGVHHQCRWTPSWPIRPHDGRRG